MLKVGNKPLLQTIVENFKKSGFENFIMCVNYKSKIIKNYFGNGKKFGVKIEYIN
jgi:NDP-sugar pyrophosphorylase family protein